MRTSDQLDKIAEALAKAQGSMKNPEKNQTAVIPHTKGGQHSYNYADLPITFDTARKSLAENGICHSFGIIEMSDHALCTCRLIHISGQWIESELRLPGNDDIKGFAANLTYLRRYLFSALIGVAGDDDMDSEPEPGAKYEPRVKPSQANSQANKAVTSTVSNAAAKPSPEKPIPAAQVPSPQLASMFKLAKDKLWTNAEVAEYLGAAFGLKGTNAMTPQQYDMFIRILETTPFDAAMKDVLNPQFDPAFADDAQLG